MDGYTARVTRYTARVTRYTGCVTRYTARVTRYTARVTRYAARVTRYTARVTRYTARVTRYAAGVTRYAARVTRYTGCGARYTGCVTPYAARGVSCRSTQHSPRSAFQFPNHPRHVDLRRVEERDGAGVFVQDEWELGAAEDQAVDVVAGGEALGGGEEAVAG